MKSRVLQPIDERSGECPDPVVPPPVLPAAALLLLARDPDARRAILLAEEADADEDGRASFSTLLHFIYGHLDELHSDYEFAAEQLSMAGFLTAPASCTPDVHTWRTEKGGRLYAETLAPKAVD